MKDWMKDFLDNCCEVDPAYKERSGRLYKAHQNYSERTGKLIRSTTDFYSELRNDGFKRHIYRYGNVIFGLRLKESEGSSHDEK